jgi:dihydrofolate synthase/folylpolyglutamate synthase
LRARPLPACAHGRGRTLAVIGVLADKDAAAIGAALAELIDRWIVCTLEGPRGLAARELAPRLAPAGASIELAGSVAEGCQLARSEAQPGDRVVVCGSVYTVGPALQWLRIY